MTLNPGHISEFVNGLHGDCMETAMAVCMAAAHGVSVTPQMLDYVVKSMQDEGIAAPNGATNINSCARWLKEKGYSVLVEVDYAEPFDGDWHALLLAHAGIHPIILNIARGGNLQDAETGAYDERALQYHGIAIIGKQSDGYLCADGDNWQVSNRYQIYTYPDLSSASPCGMVILDVTSRTYTVQPGDSLSGIAARLGLTNWSQDLWKPNYDVIGGNPDLIQPGMVLRY